MEIHIRGFEWPGSLLVPMFTMQADRCYALLLVRFVMCSKMTEETCRRHLVLCC